MSRRALIITNPGSKGDPDGYCPGVYIDKDNYINFLRSAIGGYWYSSELLHLDMPSKASVVTEIEKLRDIEYSMVIFCGHGFHSKERNSTIVQLNTSEYLDSIHLRSYSNKRTVLIDACRRVESEALMEKAQAKADSFMESRLDKDECRRYYDWCVSQCDRAVIVGFSCSIGETSGESARRGGYYSSSFIQAALNWQSKGGKDLDKYKYYFAVPRAHDKAHDAVAVLSGGTQHPEIEKPRSERFFPFAVMAS